MSEEPRLERSPGVLNKLGFVVKRQSDSVIILEHPGGRWAVVPRHDPIKIATQELNRRYRADDGRIPEAPSDRNLSIF